MYLSYNYFFFKLYCFLFAKKAGEDRYGNNIGKHITHVSSSTVFSMSLILAIIGVICIIVFREISPPPVIPHA